MLIGVNDVALGHAAKQTWNEPGEWIWSEQPAQEPLIDDDTFKRAQDARTLHERRGSNNPVVDRIIV